MDGADWLRTQLTSFACDACGRPYSASHIRVLGKRDDVFVVDLACKGCGSEAIALVSIEIEDVDEEAPDAQPVTVEAAPDPVTGDDVLEMHSFLRDFDGDFRRLFGASGG